MPPAKLMAAVKKLEEEASYAPPMGMYAEAQGDLDTGAIRSGFNKWEHSPYQRDELKPEHRKGHDVKVAFDLPEIRKRTERERVDSMTRRLMAAIESQPWEAEMILKGIQLEEWRKGHPVAYEDLRTAAAPLIEMAQKKAKP